MTDNEVPKLTRKASQSHAMASGMLMNIPKRGLRTSVRGGQVVMAEDMHAAPVVVAAGSCSSAVLDGWSAVLSHCTIRACNNARQSCRMLHHAAAHGIQSAKLATYSCRPIHSTEVTITT